MPHETEGYLELKRRCPQQRWSCGEHVYGKWEFRDLIARRAVDILQPDVNRVGGSTEAIKICAMAEAEGLPVIPHSNEAHNLHVIFSRAAHVCPWSSISLMSSLTPAMNSSGKSILACPRPRMANCLWVTRPAWGPHCVKILFRSCNTGKRQLSLPCVTEFRYQSPLTRYRTTPCDGTTALMVLLVFFVSPVHRSCKE